jgi:hypothetical protein
MMALGIYFNYSVHPLHGRNTTKYGFKSEIISKPEINARKML